MGIKRKVHAVEREIVSQNLFEHAATPAANRLQPRPKKAVMDNEEVYAALDREIDRARRSINRRADLRDRTRVLHLETVQRIRPVLDFTNAQMLVRIGNNLRKSRHARHCGEANCRLHAQKDGGIRRA